MSMGADYLKANDDFLALEGRNTTVLLAMEEASLRRASPNLIKALKSVSVSATFDYEFRELSLISISGKTSNILVNSV